jgi:hypothetical protein
MRGSSPKPHLLILKGKPSGDRGCKSLETSFAYAANKPFSPLWNSQIIDEMFNFVKENLT